MQKAALALRLVLLGAFGVGAIGACAVSGSRTRPSRSFAPDSFGGRGQVRAIEVSPDGERIAVAASDTLTVKKVPEGHEVAFLGTGVFADASYSSDGARLLAAGAAPPGVFLFDPRTARLVRAIQTGHPVKAVRFARGDALALALTRDDTLHAYDLATGAERYAFEASRLFAVSKDGARALVRPRHGQDVLQVLDTETGRFAFEVKRFMSGSVDAAAFSPDERTIAVVRGTEDTRMVDARTGAPVWERLQERAVALGFSPDGKLLVTANCEGAVKVWDATDGEKLHDLHGPETPVHSIVFSPDGSLLATAAWGRDWRRFEDPIASDFGPVDYDTDPKVRLYDPRTGRETLHLSWATLEAHHLRRTAQGFAWACGDAVVLWALGQENRPVRNHSSGSFIR